MQSSELNEFDSILPQSLACTKRIEKDYLTKILNDLKIEEFRFFGKNTFKHAKNIKKMLYRGSRDGFTFKAFHDRCDEKGPTISLFKLKHNGDCIGGYTSAQWSSDDRFKRDPCALVFSLSHQRSYKIIKPDQAIGCRKDFGPSFGNALYAPYEPFNGDNACYSESNQSTYEYIGDSNGVHDLTQTTKDEYGRYYFTISELEVWEVAFE